jgi:hypothetical protein
MMIPMSHDFHKTSPGRLDRVQKRFWQALIKQSYEARCKLVHEATEDAGELERLIPYLSQAVVDVVWYAAARGEQMSVDGVPAKILDELVESARARKPPPVPPNDVNPAAETPTT